MGMMLYPSQEIMIRMKVQYKGKEPFCVMSVLPESIVIQELKSDTPEETIVNILNLFFTKHLPEGTPLPNVLEWELGKYKWTKV